MPRNYKFFFRLFSWSFARANRCLLAIFLILGIYLLLDVLMVNSARIEEMVLEVGEEKPQALAELPQKQAVEETTQPLAYYTQAVESSNLFTAEPGTDLAAPVDTFREQAAKLRLQGIITEPVAQAIIEDTQAQKTYFLSPGEMIGGIKIKEILPGKVILDFQGQEAELTL